MMIFLIINKIYRCKLNEVSRVLKSLERMAKNNFIPSIGPIKGEIIAKIIKKYKPTNILEIGTLYGYSAILMAEMLPEDGKLITIEVNKLIADIARKNIADAGLLDKKIDVIVANALEIIPNLDWKFDLLFLDASKDEYLKYLKLSEEKLNRGSIIIADNVEVSKDEMLDYLDYVRNYKIYKSRTIETTLEYTPNVKDAIEVSIKVA
jgi:predicted O-methyltransferase YrrM